MRLTSLNACLLTALGLAGFHLRAQETEFSNVQVLGISSSGEGMGEEMRQRLAESAASFSFVSPGGSFSFGSSAGVDPNDRSQLFNLLSNESVRRELQLTDEQYAGVKKIMQASQKRLTQLVQSKMAEQRSDGGKAQVRIGGSDFREIIKENQAVAEEAIEEILLPEQLTRVRQLAYQVQVSEEGLGEALVNGRLGQEIGVHDDQKQHLTDRATKIEEEARAAIIRIRAAARAQLFSELTPDQRKAAEELMGPYFEYEELSLGQQLRKSLQNLQSSQNEASPNEK